MIAVAYEQHIGRRVPGQSGDGSSSVSASRAIPGPLDDALDRWAGVVGSPDEVSGVAVASVQHDRLESDDLGEHWRAFWKSALREL
jgi:hypothetical protein